MHPLVAYDLARLRIEEFHREAERDRLLRIARHGNDDGPGVGYRTTRSGQTVRARLAGALTLGGLVG
jgi:hypothetical protein